jgi:hypothetical protein
VATRQSRGRRARFSLRNIIRGWPFYYETTPVFPNEVLLRTVPNSPGFYTPSIPNWTINPNAFEPAKDDLDGISLFREDFVTPKNLASITKHVNGVRVARVTAKECTGLQLSLKPDPDISQPRGHVLVPEMAFIKKGPQNKSQREKIKDLAQELAQKATKNQIYTPPGLPDPVKKPKA